MRKKDSEYTANYKHKRQTKRYAFDLYLDDDVEKLIADILDNAKRDKRLKNIIVDAIKSFKNI